MNITIKSTLSNLAHDVAQTDCETACPVAPLEIILDNAYAKLDFARHLLAAVGGSAAGLEIIRSAIRILDRRLPLIPASKRRNLPTLLRSFRLLEQQYHTDCVVKNFEDNACGKFSGKVTGEVLPIIRA